MRHGKKFNHLGRTKEHRSAMLSNMATSLIMHKRIITTIAKAKALRKYVEPLITKSKSDTTHSRRVVFSYLQSKDAVMELFSTVADKVADRPGGYTRILKTGRRLGDNAEMCMMELVDFNELMLEEKAARTARSGSGKKRTRRGKKPVTAGAEVVGETVVEAGVDEVVEEVAVETEVAEDTTAEVVEEVVEETEVAEDTTAEVAVEEVVEETEVAEDTTAEVAEEVVEDVVEETEVAEDTTAEVAEEVKDEVVETTSEEEAADTEGSDEPKAEDNEEKADSEDEKKD